MWRLLISFTLSAILASLLWYLLLPADGIREDFLKVAVGVGAIFILGGEIFMAAIIPDKKERDRTRKIIQLWPGWARVLHCVGWAGGALSAGLLLGLARITSSLWLIAIPIVVFLICYLMLDHVLPGRILARLEAQREGSAA